MTEANDATSHGELTPRETVQLATGLVAPDRLLAYMADSPAFAGQMDKIRDRLLAAAMPEGIEVGKLLQPHLEEQMKQIRASLGVSDVLLEALNAGVAPRAAATSPGSPPAPTPTPEAEDLAEREPPAKGKTAGEIEAAAPAEVDEEEATSALLEVTVTTQGQIYEVLSSMAAQQASYQADQEVAQRKSHKVAVWSAVAGCISALVAIVAVIVAVVLGI